MLTSSSTAELDLFTDWSIDPADPDDSTAQIGRVAFWEMSKAVTILSDDDGIVDGWGVYALSHYATVFVSAISVHSATESQQRHHDLAKLAVMLTGESVYDWAPVFAYRLPWLFRVHSDGIGYVITGEKKYLFRVSAVAVSEVDTRIDREGKVAVVYALLKKPHSRWQDDFKRLIEGAT